ncbi:hypothetical protein ON010_g3934 [Phytophthora cinnamomi]|nr:hypothetical protein ON010_g3934 [Phytophthora cinnamomi]
MISPASRTSTERWISSRRWRPIWCTIAESGLKCESKTNVVVLGPSGAGKSSVVSFLFGTGRLIVRHQGRLSRSLVADPPLPGVEIRGGAISSTLLPVVTHVRLRSGMIAVWDMPGCRDTRGPFAELVVHFIYKWLLKNQGNLRFLLVSPPLHERLQRVTIRDLINGSLIREDNAVLVCMKCATDFEPQTIADLDLDGVDANKAHIPMFPLPAPKQANCDGHDYSAQYTRRKDDILTALGNLHSHPAEYSTPLPDAAVLLLGQMTTACVTFVQDRLSAIFLEEYKWENYCKEFDETDYTLDELQCGGRMSPETVVDTLTRLVPEGARLRYDEGLINACERLNTLSILNGRGYLCNMSDWLSPNANRTLEIAKAKLVGLKNAVESYFEKLRSIPNTLIASAFHLRLSDEQASIEKFVKKLEMAIDRVEAIPNVIIIGYASLDVDVGLQMWANVALVSPSIQVTTKYVFDLSAVGQAACAEKCNEDAGKNGLHGTPGLPGGNLTVRSRPKSTEDCSPKPDDSPLGGFTYGIPGRRDLTLMRDSEPGKPRLHPGSGGRGGAGGKGGVVLIRSARQSVWEATGSIGPQGLDGKAGAASRDGLSSPSFTATIQQWYSKGGWRGNHFSDPKIDVAAEPLAHEEQPKHIHATPSTEHGDDSINNTGLRLDFAQDKYQEQLGDLLFAGAELMQGHDRVQQVVGQVVVVLDPEAE